jgi:hypothetical protein
MEELSKKNLKVPTHKKAVFWTKKSIEAASSKEEVN